MLGLGIAPLESAEFEGTGALYIRENNMSDRVFLLTCAHVARPPSKYPNTGMSCIQSSHPQEHIIALGQSGYTGALRSIMRAIGQNDETIQDWQAMRKHLEEQQVGEPESVSKKRNELLALVEKAREEMKELNAFHSKITKLWSLPEDRVIGNVIHVEPIGVGAEPPFTEDWALIALDEHKFKGSVQGNVVYIGGNLSREEYRRRLYPRRDDRINFIYPKNGLLQARGIIQRADIHDPKHLDAHGEPCLLVIKNGLSTGTTVGRVLGMESYTRTYTDSYEIKKTSVEIAVVASGKRQGPFSAPGDSGSIVLDRDGRILGMLTSGAGTTDTTDVTYVTPYFFLDKAIKKHFPNSFLYEAVE
ncbi:hypothetical protein PQX77_005244 [Marasmius sp. AFHP31]|nr:hypothetical protein PQX77_005244 [Marasmius sp. AFHP31]